MALAISQAGVKVGIYTLLEAPLTLASSGAQVWIPEPGLVGSGKHRELFSRYRDEVDEVAAVALDWWTETLEAHLDAIGPKRLILTHMSDDMLSRLDAIGHAAARDGMIVEI